MARIRVYQEIENDIWTLTFVNDKEHFDDSDKRLIKKFGEPEINLGGTFGDIPDDFAMPETFVKLVSGFPVTVTFDSRGIPFDGNTTTKVLVYRDAIIRRIADAFVALRAAVDGFTGEKIYEV